MAGAKIGWKLVETAFVIGVTLVTKKLLDVGWKLGSGAQPPKDPKQPETTYAEVVTWAVASGAAAALAKRFAASRAEQYWLNSTGHLPPGHDDTIRA